MKLRPQNPRYQITPLGHQHNRAAFSCGIEPLDRYLQKQASQDVAKHVAAVFVISPDAEFIAGYYTLSAHTLNLGELPPEVAKRLPRYPSVPATLIGRLAVSQSFQGQGLGEFLLFDALRRALAHSHEVASFAVIVDAKNEDARSFYLRHEFLSLPAQSNRLYYPMKSIEDLVRSAEG